MDDPRVETLAVEATHDLRRRVLRSGRGPVAIAEDHRPGAWHLGVRVGDDLVAVGSFYPSATPCRPGVAAVQLRFMAVEPGRQRQGLGTVLIGSAIARLRAGGVRVLWANARDTAIGFYESQGFRVQGEGFIDPATSLGHHVVVYEIPPAIGERTEPETPTRC